jgi:hypothetical protein
LAFAANLIGVFWDARIEIGRPFFDPIDKFGNSWILPQRIN